MKLYEVDVSQDRCHLLKAEEGEEYFTVRLPWWKVFLVRIVEALYDKVENWMIDLDIEMTKVIQEKYEKDHPRKFSYRENYFKIN